MRSMCLAQFKLACNILLSWMLLFSIAQAETRPVIIPLADIQKALQASLRAQGIGKEEGSTLDVYVTSFTQYNLTIQSPIPTPSLQVQELKLKPAQQRFQANLVFSTQDTTIQTIPIMGRYEEHISVPVLKIRMQAGDIIHENDLTTSSMNAAHLKRTVIRHKEAMLGKTLKRTTFPYSILTEDMISEPFVLQKNTPVTMKYVTSSLTITDLGVALEQGAVGTVVRVKNMRSNQIVNAIVRDAHTVQIVTSSSRSTTHADSSL